MITDVAKPESVTLLRTGKKLDCEYRDGAMRVVVPGAMRSTLPDMVKIVFGE